jgi:hypothetical protein
MGSPLSLPICKSLLTAHIGNQWIQSPTPRDHRDKSRPVDALTRKLQDTTTHLCIDISGTTVSAFDSIVINDQEFIPASTSAFTFSAPEVNHEGLPASAPPPFQWKAHEQTHSIDRTRAIMTITNAHIAWMALNAKSKSMWKQTGTIRPKGYNTQISAESAVDKHNGMTPSYCDTYTQHTIE